MFAEFYTDFNKYARYLKFNDKALKCHLECAISEKLFCQLVSSNFRDLCYLQLVQECQTQNNQQCAAVTNACKTMPSPQLFTKFNQSPVQSSTQTTVCSTPPKPTMPDANAMDLACFKLIVQERECCRTQGLCFYNSLASHITSSCLSKPSDEHIRTIQEGSTAQPTQNAFQDQGKA